MIRIGTTIINIANKNECIKIIGFKGKINKNKKTIMIKVEYPNKKTDYLDSKVLDIFKEVLLCYN